MNLVIITINFNSSENTIKLLESLKNQTDKDFDIIVVDNNSEHEELQKLKNYRTEETNILFIENDKNLGFSGGNNVGIREALRKGADWVILINNDAWVQNDFISLLKAELVPKEGIVGLAIDEGSRVVYAGKIEWLKPTLSHETTSDIPKNSYTIGGAMAIHKKVFEKIGFLDERYFLYFEDADFSVRARQAGVPVSFLSDIKVSHSVSASTKKLGSPMLLYYHYRNAFYFNRKNGPWHVKIRNVLWRQMVVQKQLLKLLLGVEKDSSRAILEGAHDYYKNKMGKHA